MQYLFVFILILFAKITHGNSLDNNFWIVTQVKTSPEINTIISFSRFQFLNEKIENNQIVYCYSVSIYFNHWKPNPDKMDTAFIIQNEKVFEWLSSNNNKRIKINLEDNNRQNPKNGLDEDFFDNNESQIEVSTNDGKRFLYFNDKKGNALVLENFNQPFLMINSHDTLYAKIKELDTKIFENVLFNNKKISNRLHFVEGDSFVINEYYGYGFSDLQLTNQHFYSSKYNSPGSYNIYHYKKDYSNFSKYIKKEKTYNLSMNDSGYFFGSNFVKYTFYEPTIYIDTTEGSGNSLKIFYPKPIFVHPSKKDTIWTYESIIYRNNSIVIQNNLTTYPIVATSSEWLFSRLQNAYAKLNDVYKPYINLIPTDTLKVINYGVQDMYLKDGKKLMMDVMYQFPTELSLTISQNDKQIFNNTYQIKNANSIYNIPIDIKVQQGKTYQFKIHTTSSENDIKRQQTIVTSVDTFKVL